MEIPDVESTFIGVGEAKAYNTFSTKDKARNGSKVHPRYTLNDAVEKLGFGKFQVFITLASGFVWISDGMEIMVLAIIGPVLLCEWRLTTVEEALLTTVVFLGFGLGSAVFGWIADKYGRKTALMLNCGWTFFYGILSACAPLFVWIILLRFLVGFGIGGTPVVVAYSTEFLTNKARGKAIILVELFWACGGIIEVILAILVLLPYGWRWWLVASAVPSGMFFLFSYWLPESPRYHLVNNEPERALKTLQTAAKVNGVELPPGELIPEPEPDRANIRDLFEQQFKRTSLLLCYLWYACAFCYYGSVLFATEIIKIGTTCEAESFGNTTSDFSCVELGLSEYYDLLWTSPAEIPGLILTLVLIDFLGRKWTLCLEMLLFAAVCAALCICMDKIPMLVLLFSCRALSASTLQILFLYTSEVYPTNCRGLSLGLGSMMGRVGALTTPYVAQVLLSISLYYALTAYAVVGLVGAVIAACLTIDTKGRSLVQSRNEVHVKDF